MKQARKKCLFLVQGEGRGHMTQSISMKQVLDSCNIDVCEVIIGKSDERKIPDFYYEKIKVHISQVESPNMLQDKKHKSINLFSSIVKNTLYIPRFIKSIKTIHQKVKEHKPDGIINFYEPLCGVYNLVFRPRIPTISIAHHYMYLHPDYVMPKKHSLPNLFLKAYTRLTSIGSERRLALSFYPFKNNPKNAVSPVPPLLRNEVFDLTVTQGKYLLVYLLNSGYVEDIIAWHKKHPEVMLHCFTEHRKDGQYDDTLHFHKLNDKEFLKMMAGAEGVVTTSGFESVCEALYMGKPVLMVPVEGQYEQFCNSRDAAKAGLGMFSDKFNIDNFLHYIGNHKNDTKEFSKWVDKSHQLIGQNITEVLNKSA